MPSTTDSAQPEAAGEFVEQAPHEAGFASIYTEMVAPHLGGLQRARERAVKRRRLQVVAGITIIFLIWMGVWLWGIGGVHFLILLIAGLLSLVTADLLLRRGTQPHRRTATMLRDLLIKAVCEQVEGLVYQRVAGRKVNHDRLVALSLAPRHATALIENFFGATRHTMAFRAVQASLRNNHRQEIFRGLLIEVDLPEPFDGRIVLARRDEPPRDDIAWEPPPGDVIDLKGHPAFQRLFQVCSDNPEAAERLLTEALKTALVRLDEQLDGAVFRAGFASGCLLLTVPLEHAVLEIPSNAPGPLDPSGDAHRLLKITNLPIRIIDTLHGIDPDSGGRYRAR